MKLWQNLLASVQLHSSKVLVFVTIVVFTAGFIGCASKDQARPSASAEPTPTPDPKVSAAPVPPAPPESSPNLAADEISLFDGQTLTGWAEADFAGKGEVKVEEGKIIIGMGVMTGITWTNDLPRMNYEVTLEAMRVDGSDFFCALTFPYNQDPCSLIVGGWGGGLIGLSCLDGEDAANNETTQFMDFENGKWFQIRLRVLPNKIQAWIGDERMVDVLTEDRKVSIRWEVEPCLPFGIATWATTGAIRNIRIRRL